MFRSCNFRSLGGPGPLPFGPWAVRSFLRRSWGFFRSFLRIINHWKNDAWGIILSNLRNFYQWFLHALVLLLIPDHKVEQCMSPKLMFDPKVIKVPKVYPKNSKNWQIWGPKKTAGLSVLEDRSLCGLGPPKKPSVRAVLGLRPRIGTSLLVSLFPCKCKNR